MGRIADSRYLDFARSRSCSGTKFGKTKQAVGLEMIEESAVLLLLQLAGGTFPLEEFAKSSGKLGQAEVGKIADRVADELDVIGREGMSGKLRRGRKHRVVPDFHCYHTRVEGDCSANNSHRLMRMVSEGPGPGKLGPAMAAQPEKWVESENGCRGGEIKSTCWDS